MRQILTFTADGIPAPQGSKKTIPAKDGRGHYTGKVSVLESSARLKPWRQVVAAAARLARGPMVPAAGPIVMTLEFRLPRPKGHYGTGRNAGKLKPSAPEHHLVKPDVDKLERGILDALTMAGLYGDDSQVVAVTSFKRYADHAAPGVTVTAMSPAHDPQATAQQPVSA